MRITSYFKCEKCDNHFGSVFTNKMALICLDNHCLGTCYRISRSEFLKWKRDKAHISQKEYKRRMAGYKELDEPKKTKTEKS